jgi:hypothetical protein
MKIKNNKVIKPKNRIFNFPLSSTDRNHLEELAAAWGLSLAGAIRRSLITAYENLEGQRSAATQEQPKDNQIKTLETMLAVHTELTTTRSKMDSIINLIKISSQENNVNFQKLSKPLDSTSIRMLALINTLNSRDQIEIEIQKLTEEKQCGSGLQISGNQ